MFISSCVIEPHQEDSCPDSGGDCILNAIKKITGENLVPPKEIRYVGQNCKEIRIAKNNHLLDKALNPYKHLPVKDCSPFKSNLQARALVLLPSAKQVYAWIIKSCHSIGQTGDKFQACGEKLLNFMNEQNGLQFIVSGLIHEPKKFGFDEKDENSKRCTDTADQEVLYSFRDGITVHLKGQDRISWRKEASEGCEPIQPSNEQLLRYLSTDPKDFSYKGRITGIDRKIYAACTNDQSVLPAREKIADARWRSIVREDFISAWKHPEKGSKLLNIVAQAIINPSGECKMK